MGKRALEAVLAEHQVLVAADSAFQRRARLLQALWREEHHLPIGVHRGRPLGSRIDLAHGRQTLAAFLTDGIRAVVREAVLGAGRARDQVIFEDRLFANLLSSQPLCFNLFGELARDLDLATRVLRELEPGIARVTSITFEHSPSRGDPRFTGDRSAFDTFVTYASERGGRGFLGVEVKYHEALGDEPASHRARYDELADAMACFVPDRAALRAAPLQQIWRDHLLAGALLAGGEYDEGAFVLLSPRANVACERALDRYRAHVSSDATFRTWHLEDFARHLARATDEAPWTAELEDRYVAFERADVLADREAVSCPRCEARRPLPIVRGKPHAIGLRMAERGELVLGGCRVAEDDPAWTCPACGHAW